MGTIFERGNMLYLRYYDPNKKYTVSESTGLGAGSKNLKKAEVLLRAKETAKDNDEPIPSAKTRKTTMQQLFNLVITDYKNEEQRSIDKIERMIKKHVGPVFSLRRANTVTEADLEMYKSERRKHASKATVNRELSLIRRAFNLGKALKSITRSPKFVNESGNSLLMDESDNVKEDFFEFADFMKVHAHLADYAKPIAEYGYTFGQRKEEILSILWKQTDKKNWIDRVNCVITLSARKTKNKKTQRIYYGKNTGIVDLIEKQYQRKLQIEESTGVEVTHVFFHNDGRAVKSFRGSWDAACAASGIDLCFHDLRRTAVRNLIRNGVPEKIAMQISGHKTRSIIDRYNIVNENDLEIAASKVGLNAEIERNFERNLDSASTEKNSDLNFISTKQ